MHLSHLYKKLYETSLEHFKKDDYFIDASIDAPDDNRFGIALIIRPSEAVKEEIQMFLNQLKNIESAQYFYPNSGLHITVLSIISCAPGFGLHQISVPEYVAVVQKSVKAIAPFKIRFQGVTVSNSGVMIQGFPEDNALENLRNNLRENFRTSNLFETIDERYKLQMAHATVMRFRRKFQQKSAFLKLLEQYRKHDFGTFEVGALNLVFNDWYHREKTTQLLKTFDLIKKS